MDYFEVITDAVTGAQTTRPYTQDEINALLAEQAKALEAERAALQLSFAQLVIGLVSEGWISEADGEGWLGGTLPGAVLATINLLPADQRFAAKAKATRPSFVARMDPLVGMMAKAQGRSDDEIDAFFRKYVTV